MQNEYEKKLDHYHRTVNRVFAHCKFDIFYQS
jgi:hypothetical protein